MNPLQVNAQRTYTVGPSEIASGYAFGRVFAWTAWPEGDTNMDQAMVITEVRTRLVMKPNFQDTVRVTVRNVGVNAIAVWYLELALIE
jgi:hypothetical protein